MCGFFLFRGNLFRVSLHNAALALACTVAALGAFALIYALVYRATAKAYYKLVRA